MGRVFCWTEFFFFCCVLFVPSTLQANNLRSDACVCTGVPLLADEAAAAGQSYRHSDGEDLLETFELHGFLGRH